MISEFSTVTHYITEKYNGITAMHALHVTQNLGLLSLSSYELVGFLAQTLLLSIVHKFSIHFMLGRPRDLLSACAAM